MQDQGEEGIAQLRQELTAHRATGAEFAQPSYLAMLAEAYGNGGQAEEGLSTVAEALALVDKTGERIYEAELYRLKGELLLTQESMEQRAGSAEQKSRKPNPHSQILDPQGEAEACFLKAIDVARRQQAKSLELRAVMSLVRLRQHQAVNHAPRYTHHVFHDTQHDPRTKLDDAHRMLSEIYHWFMEGFDTKDLQEARALLGLPITRDRAIIRHKSPPFGG